MTVVSFFTVECDNCGNALHVEVGTTRLTPGAEWYVIHTLRNRAMEQGWYHSPTMSDDYCYACCEGSTVTGRIRVWKMRLRRPNGDMCALWTWTCSRCLPNGTRTWMEYEAAREAGLQHLYQEHTKLPERN